MPVGGRPGLLGAGYYYSRAGTVNSTSSAELMLHPEPSSDPDDPLNWSKMRKAVNFSMVGSFVLWTFVQLQVGPTAWGPMIAQLHFSIDQLNQGSAMVSTGLALGCIMFVPFVHKYGRRPLYIMSSLMQLGAVIWQARTYTYGDLMGATTISGLGGAVSEAIVQITIADVFFVHQHGTMNAWYLIFTAVGATLGPVASGFIVQNQGWRWVWWYCTIFLTINLFLVVFFFEESKYVPVINGHSVTHTTTTTETDMPKNDRGGVDDLAKETPHEKHVSDLQRLESRIDPTLPRKTYRQRMAFYTKSEGSIAHHFYQPVIVLFTFPAATYAALTYGMLLACLALMSSMSATYMLNPPYNFGPAGVGLINLAPFTGSAIGFFVGGTLNDVSIMWLAKRNKGIYEPEMRLWVGLAAAILLPAGLIIFGVALSKGLHWMIICVGFSLFGFCFVFASGVALSYATDCYQEILGDVMIGVTFVRNAFSVVILFSLTPWIKLNGIQNVCLITAAICFVILLVPIPLLIWGKRIRIATAQKYKLMALRQPSHRTVPN
ncbi:major facilitator superfamily transporter [Pyrenophora seminiperda CCB06]|uniref:Major facilitator superfamily transporter n=1 Tax=Pyrenophora seminiperda CCB06 TaxID=1302712 RepID=A0A3M7M970_9PLEO|nr:major facilitator superfamily transporter [Pyrenophora seminiperda CCB06]